ncbi:MAG TPA: hypothetical protein VNL14_20480 [Candidatus Acidoferrales bacterium]|nr:hypothetical protein [Candidatus Acidoferrales bacterium]
MKNFIRLAAICFASLLAGSSYGHFTGKGHVHTLAETAQVFLNPDCRSTGTCDLKRFKLTTYVHEVWFSDDPNYPTYGNSAIMEYETDSVEALEKYAIVQFIKGCVFLSAEDATGGITRDVRETSRSFGETVPLCFPKWVIDSQDADPVYNSDPEYGRFHWLRWNKPGSYDNRTQRFYGYEKPKVPIVYVADHPSGAFVSETGVKNTALQFNTCIFRARDVPAATRRENIHFAEPIACFEWQNVYVYDFAKKRFETDPAYIAKLEEPSTGADPYLVLILVALAAGAVVILCWRLVALRSRAAPRPIVLGEGALLPRRAQSPHRDRVAELLDWRD